MTFEDLLFLFFYFFILTMPYVKFSVPAFGSMELTSSDVSMLLLAFVSLLLIKRISPLFKPYLLIFAFFNFAILLSFVYAKDGFIFIRDFFPNIFAFLIIITTLTFFSVGDKVKRLLTIRNVMILTLVIGGIPAYLEAIGIIPKMHLFYDRWLWRYTFLSQNPNQYGVASILYIFLVVTIDLMFKRSNMKKDLFVILFCLVPMLYSGSRTAILSFSIVTMVILFYLFKEMRFVSKVIIGPLAVILLIVGVGSTLEFMRGKGGQINRALSIFDKIEKGENIAEIEGGTGQSINDAIRLIKKYPILGVGIGNKRAYSTSTVEIHNTYLKFLAETGLVGFIGFLSIFLLPLITVWKSKTKLFNRLIYLGFFLIFAGMNYPHMLFRQRWVWFFMVLSYVIGKVALEEYEKEKIAREIKQLAT